MESDVSSNHTSLTTLDDRFLIQRKLDQVRHCNYFEILECFPDDPLSVIKNNHGKLIEIFNPERFSGQGSEEISKILGEIKTVLNDAYEVLSDPVLRVKYKNALKLF
jgi:hypothetical protein